MMGVKTFFLSDNHFHKPFMASLYKFRKTENHVDLKLTLKIVIKSWYNFMRATTVTQIGDLAG